MTTQRLYYDDPWLHRFEAHVLGVAPRDGGATIELDRTAFYPESGGQMADRGTLGAASVVDVKLEGERVLHVVSGPAPEPGERVVATVDRARRRAHMALHTGQHILSRALHDVAGADTISSRLGETQCTIDLDADRLDEATLAEAEALANAVIDDDVVVRAFFPESAELATLALRKRPPLAARVRVVAVGDFDVTPCGGTHCTRSGQVGLIALAGLERHKQKLRLSFEAGPRARRLLSEHDRTLRELARAFSCGPLLLPGAIDKLRLEHERARAEARSLGAVAAEHLAAALLREAQGGPLVAAIDGPVAVIREVAKRVADSPDHVALLAAHDEEATHVVLQRGQTNSFDCAAFMQRLAARTGGRGGGRPPRAEGRLPPGVAWARVVAELLDEG